MPGTSCEQPCSAQSRTYLLLQELLRQVPIVFALTGQEPLSTLRQALTAPALPQGLHCVLQVRMRQVVVGRRWLHGVGCTAELKQVKWQMDGSVAVIAKGQRRALQHG